MRARTRFNLSARIASVACCAALSPALLFAQSDDDANGAVQFNFSNPGARSLAMGGAFVGAADDATAAYTNPAGLFQLSEPEITVEGRQWSYSTPFADRGRFSGDLTGLGDDTVNGVEFGRTSDELSGISYASFVYPKPKWAFALFYHQVANYEANFETNGVFIDDSRLFPARSSYDLDVSQIGAALAFKFGKGSAGIAISDYQFELNSLTQRFSSLGFGPPNFNDPQNFQSQIGDSNEIGFNVGLRYESSPNTKFGLAYRFGPEFDINVSAVGGTPTSPFLTFVNQDTVLDLPDVFTFGFSHQPRQNLTINFDVSRVLYSQLVGNEDDEQLFVVIFGSNSSPVARAEDFAIDDVTEFRLGIEYVFDQVRIPIAFRAGAWWDPDHRLRYEGQREATRARLFAGDDELHVSAGFGLVLGPHFQIDAAADLSDNYDVFSVSTVIRF